MQQLLRVVDPVRGNEAPADGALVADVGVVGNVISDRVVIDAARGRKGRLGTELLWKREKRESNQPFLSGTSFCPQHSQRTVDFECFSVAQDKVWVLNFSTHQYFKIPYQDWKSRGVGPIIYTFFPIVSDYRFSMQAPKISLDFWMNLNQFGYNEFWWNIQNIGQKT